MEEKDIELIKELAAENEEVKQLWEEHLKLKTKLEDFNKRKYLTTEDELERKKLQKLKLVGKDRLEEILHQHRND